MGGPEDVCGVQPRRPHVGGGRTEGRQDAGAAGRRGVEGSRKVQRLSQRGRESPDAAREPAIVRRARRSDQEAAGRDGEVGETGRGYDTHVAFTATTIHCPRIFFRNTSCPPAASSPSQSLISTTASVAVRSRNLQLTYTPPLEPRLGSGRSKMMGPP